VIIFGTRNRIGTVERGTFACPRCGPGQSYERKHAKRWFTLYFIPIFPVGDLGQFIECGLCRGTFKIEVLSLRAPASSASNPEVELKRAMLRALIVQVPADAEPERVQAALATYTRLTSMPVSEAELARERAALAGVDLDAYFTGFARGLSASQKERLLQVAVATAARSDAKDAELTAFGLALGLTEAHVRGVLIPVAPAASA
jgi:hypothetical protein